MIDFRDGQITDVLSPAYRAEPWVRAVSYAYKQLQDLILSFSDRLLIWSSLDTVPEDILDALAIEMRVIAYDESFSKVKKSELIKNAFLVWTKSGTKKSLEDVAAAIFENASIVEWFDYGGDPSHFRIHTTNPNVADAELNRLREVVRDYKRLSSTLDEVYIDYFEKENIYFGFITTIVKEIKLRSENENVMDIDYLIDETESILVDEKGSMIY